MKRIEILILTFFIICSCEQYSQPTDTTDKIITEDTQRKLDNQFTQIILSFCNDIYNHKFTEENTKHFTLNTQNDIDCFVFSSDIVCGAPSGSCGLDIKVIRKIGDKHKIVYETCGFNLTHSIESNFGYNSFTYDNKDGITNKVSFDGNSFIETPITINNLDYDKINVIAKQTNNDITSFILDDKSSSDNIGNRVQIEKIKIGKNYYAELYTVYMAPIEYFLFFDNNLIFTDSDICSLETITDNTKDFYNIKTYRTANYELRQDTSYLIPIIYEYFKPIGKYKNNGS